MTHDQAFHADASTDWHVPGPEAPGGRETADGRGLLGRTHQRAPLGAGGVRADVLAARAEHLRDVAAGTPTRRWHRSRRPEVGLALALALGLIAAFLGSVSADPFWLTVGAGDRGTVTVTDCSDGSVTGGCAGRFVPTAGGAPVAGVRISSLSPSLRTVGTAVPARMRDGGWAYAGSTGGLALRWVLGLLLAVGCGAGTAVATGVPWLRRERRHQATLLWALAVGGPVLLFLGAVLAGLHS